jgi:hypothetical protein
LLIACNGLTNKDVTVKGSIEHLGKSELYVSYYKEKGIIANDTITSNEAGKFEFLIDSFDETTPVTIYFHNNDCWTTLFAKSGDKIEIKGDIYLVDLLDIKGGEINNDLSRFKQQIKPLYLDRQEILSGKYNDSPEDTEIKLAEINLALKRKAKEFILDNTNSVASVVLIQDFFYQDYDPITKDLISELRGDAAKFHLTNRIRESILNW